MSTMSVNEVRCLKRFFEKKSLHISDYWLQCCLEWFKGEYTTYTEDLMCNSVYQQWLDSDLRDIEVRSLPNNLTQQKNTIINGKYAVQVLYVKDISKPAYSQLKSIRDPPRFHVNNDHENENEFQETTGTGKRVLYLYMTDGVQKISGFEYHSIPCLNLYMTPGIKLLLAGPLIVRNGEFMLKENNVQILGGEVEDLKIVNAAENVLARELNLPENPNPKTSESNTIQRQTNNNTSCVVPVNNHRNVNVMMELENDQFLLNVDTSAFEEQEAAMQTLIQEQDADLDMDDDLFEALDIPESPNVLKQNSTTSICDAEFVENLEQIERQEFERRLEEAEEDFDFHLEDDVDIVNKIIEAKSKPINVPVINTPQPFIYIKYLQDNLYTVSSDKTFRVKAWFSNNIEKLKLSKNKGWTMKFEIKDASGTIIVDFLSSVIEELMGLSPSEALTENRNVKHKVTKSHEKLTQALNKCKEKMESLEYIMDLKCSEDKTSLTVNRLEPVNKQLLKDLKNCVQSVPVKLL